MSQCGTPLYMSPELLTNSPYDERDPASMGNIDLRWDGRAVVSLFDGSAGMRGEDDLSVRFDQDEGTLRRNRRLWGNFTGELSYQTP